MKVLFVYIGFGKNLINHVVDAQANSLRKEGIQITSYPIPGGGINYLKSYFELRKLINNNTFDLVHGHYSYSAILSWFCNPGKTIASLMVGDIDKQTQNFYLRKVALFFSRFIWIKTIVKSKRMQSSIQNSVVIPNGVDYDIFKVIPKNKAIKKVSFEKSKINIIFIAQKPYSHKWKNLNLAKKAIKILNNKNIKLHIISKIDQKNLYNYYCAADIMLQTSSLEGSPNVIKEALACNCPIVTTDVGDSKENIKNTDGCYLTSYDVNDISEKINKAIKFGKRTNGRNDIIHLERSNVSKKIINIYNECIKI